MNTPFLSFWDSIWHSMIDPKALFGSHFNRDNEYSDYVQLISYICTKAHSACKVYIEISSSG
jgi:hypothetical protein